MSKTPDQLTIMRLRLLLDETYAAMLAAGWRDGKDNLMQRIKAEGTRTNTQAAVHAMALGQVKDQ